MDMIFNSFMLFNHQKIPVDPKKRDIDFRIIVILLDLQSILAPLGYLVCLSHVSTVLLFFPFLFIYAVFFVAIKVQWPCDEHHHSKEDRNMFFALLLPTTWRMGSHLVSVVNNHGDRKSP